MIRQLAILFSCLGIGELIVYLTGIALPSSIIGMIVLALCLETGVIRIEWIQSLSRVLISNMGFFFVPTGVGLMLYFDIIKAQFWPIVVATVASTAVVLVVTGWMYQLVRKHGIRRK